MVLLVATIVLFIFILRTVYTVDRGDCLLVQEFVSRVSTLVCRTKHFVRLPCSGFE